MTLVNMDFCGRRLYVGAYPGLERIARDHGVLRHFGVTRLVNATSDQPSIGNRTLQWEVIGYEARDASMYACVLYVC